MKVIDQAVALSISELEKVLITLLVTTKVLLEVITTLKNAGVF